MRAAPRFESLSGWLEWQESLHPRAIEPGLDRVARVLGRTGWLRPQQPVLTIGGTNGKGSCVALLDSILQSAGFRVATFTSPHLIDYRERIRLDGVEVSASSLIVSFERIADALGDDTLTFFEFNTLAALLVFESAAPDAVVLEVGMGGRLDSVNVVDPDVAVVVSIGLDHTDWLGDDLASIAREKAGIFRAGRPAIYGGREPSPALETAARACGALLERRGVDFHVSAEPDGHWCYEDARGLYADLPVPALAGRNQLDNAAAALAALSALKHRLPVTRAAIVRGLGAAFLPGRFQQVHAVDRHWVLDVAHNADAARVLADNLRHAVAAGRTLAVCAMLSDKDVDSVLRALHGVVDEWFAATTPGPRGLTADRLAGRAASSGIRMHIASDVGDAMQRAASASFPADRIVVFGSFHTVGPAIEWLRNRAVPGDRWLRNV